MAFKTVTAAILAGGITLGAIVTWDGGAIIDNAQDLITEQAAELNLFGQQQKKLVEKIGVLKQELADLKAGGNADKAKIAELEKQIADMEASVQPQADEIVEHIELQEAEMYSANTDAAELGETIATVGETAEPMTQAEIDAIVGPIETTEPVEPDPVPQYETINMVAGTPVALVENLVMNKREVKVNGVVTGYTLFIENNTNDAYKIVIDGTEFNFAAGQFQDLGNVADFDGDTMTVTGFGIDKTYTLINK